MATQAVTLQRDAYPHDVLLFERDDVLWIRGRDLERAKGVLGFCTDGQECIGFDRETASYYIRALLEQGLSVGVARGHEVQTITLRGSKDPAKVPSQTIWVSPVLLYGQREMERLARHHTRRRSPTAAVVERLRSELLKGNDTAISEIGDLYVYQVAADMYEVELGLTAIPEEVVEAFAVAAHLAGRKLRCRLVEPKARRGKKTDRARSKIVVNEPVKYGQLQFQL